MIAIIDYEAGNLTSVKRALDYLGIEAEITADQEKILSAEKVIFPGVGHAATAMSVLRQRGLDNIICSVFKNGTPLLGICLGSQIILTRSEEGNAQCLDLIPGSAVKFKLNDSKFKIPHMGWNSVEIKKKHFLLKDLHKGSELYFVHSYYPKPDNEDHVFAVSDYQKVFPVAIGYKNLFATQFHPEKSGPVGLQILRNFSQWDGVSC